MLKINPSKCTECEICMQICSWEHEGENNPKRSRIWIEAVWPETPEIFVCQACENHEWVEACPTEALVWENYIKIDTELCTSCESCVEACPVGGIRLDPVSAFPLVCDTCGGAFQCVQWCPTQAIERI